MTAATTPIQSELRQNWTMLLASHVGIALGAMSIPTYTIGAFIRPLHAAFGWSGPQVQAAILVSQIMCGVGAMLAGFLIDRIGIRRLAMTGSIGVAISLLFAGANPGSLPLFWLAFALLAILGCGSGPVAWTRAIAGGFDRQRGSALAIALSGTGLAGFVLPPLVVAVNQSHGWRAGMFLLALLPLLVALPLTGRFFHPEQPRPTDIAEPPPANDGIQLRAAMRSRRFWVLLLSVLCVYLAITGIVPNLIPSLTAGGFAPVNAALIQSFYAVALVGGRLMLGWLVDRFWAPGVAALVLTPAALGCLIFTANPGFVGAIAGVALIGLAAGAELDLLAFLTARYFGVAGFARIYAALYLTVAVGAGIGPLSFALIVDRTGTTTTAFGICGAMFFTGGMLMLALGRYPADFQSSSERLLDPE